MNRIPSKSELRYYRCRYPAGTRIQLDEDMNDENNILHLVNKYMDLYLSDKTNLSAKAKAEKYAKITAKTIINIGGGDSSNYGQNAFFYDAAEGLLASVILLLAEFGEKNERHITRRNRVRNNGGTSSNIYKLGVM